LCWETRFTQRSGRQQDFREAKEHFGWFAQFAAADIPASGQWTRERLGWQPKQPGLIADLDGPHYFESENAA
jgi:hypothetical protein